jgi:superfamily I DNA and/or RNA helicase
MKLIIIGDPQTMTRHPFYRKLYEYIEALKQ